MKRIEHIYTAHDLDLDEVRRRVSQQVGRDLGLVAQPPTDTTPGVLLFEEMGSDERVELDPRDVVSVIDGLVRDREAEAVRVEVRRREEFETALQPPVLNTFNAAQLVGFDAATSDEDRWAVVREFFRVSAETEAKINAEITAQWEARRAELGITDPPRRQLPIVQIAMVENPPRG